MKLYNYYELANEADARGKKIHIDFGRWPYSENVDQQFRREEAEKIAEELNTAVAKGEPGIPVYQGHPDVPDLAYKYPDKGAIGWVKRMDVGDKGVDLTVEWDRWPGKGFAWFSPYWAGEPQQQPGGKILVTVTKITSVGLVNRPNVKDFRLPNEEVEIAKEEQAMKEVATALGLPETATTEEIVAMIGKIKADAKECGEAKVALEDECNKAKCANEELTKKLSETETKLANSEKKLSESETALANEKAEIEKIKALKTQSVTANLPNEAKTLTRMDLVNEKMSKMNCDFGTAWAAAKTEKPELFA